MLRSCLSVVACCEAMGRTAKINRPLDQRTGWRVILQEGAPKQEVGVLLKSKDNKERGGGGLYSGVDWMST